MSIDHNLLKVFIKVAELGSFTQAAKVLNQPKSRVSRALARLERELGVQLLRRTTRKTSLTQAGKEFYQGIYPLLNAISTELAKVSAHQIEMSGTIRLTASQDIGQTLVSKIISQFHVKHPLVQFETLITNDFLDLTKENIDIAFRAGKLPDSTLKQKKILTVRFLVVCSKGYSEKYGHPRDVRDLCQHRFLSFRNMEKDFFKKDFPIKPLVVSDSIPMLLNMALNGDGITILPDFFCKEYLESKQLLNPIPGWESVAAGIHILYPPTKGLSKKVRAFIEMAVSFSNF